MVTALTPGRFYFIESDAIDNQDWVAGSGDPDDIDLDNFIETTEYCSVEIPESFKKAFKTGARVTDVAGGKSWDLRLANRAYAVLARGIMTSIVNADKIDEFMMSDRHTTGGDLFKRYYLICHFGVNDQLKFTDAESVRQLYCKGIVVGGSIDWKSSDNLNAKARLNWRSVW